MGKDSGTTNRGCKTENGRDLCKELKILGKKTLDKMGWNGWLVVERSRDKDDVRNVKKNYGANIEYLKKVFQ